MSTAYINPDQQSIDRRRAIAMALQQASMQPMELPNVHGARVSPLEGVNKIAQALMANYQNNQLDQQQQALTGQQQQSRLAQALAVSNSVTPQPQGLPAPMAQPQEAPIPGENAVPPMSAPPVMTQLPVGPGQIQARGNSVSALAQALSSQDPTMIEAGKSMLQSQLVGNREQQARQAELAQTAAAQQHADEQARLSRIAENAKSQNVILNENQRNEADIASREKIAGDKVPAAKNPGSRESIVNGRKILEYFDQSDPSTVTYSKDVGPAPTPSETALERANTSSQQFNLTRLDKDRAPIAAAASAIAESKGMLAENNPQANALVAPVLIKAILPAGAGSNLRITQSEMNSVGTGTKIQDFEKWLGSWSTDPTKYQKLLPEQKVWLNGVLDKISEKAQAKLTALDSASEAITNGKTPQEHQRAYADAQKALSAIDAGILPKELPKDAIQAIRDAFKVKK